MVKVSPKKETILEDGWYPAKITTTEEIDTKYGERILIPFDVYSEGSVIEVAAFVSISDHAKSNLVKWGKALFGDRPFDTDEFNGLECEVRLEEGEDGEGERKNFIRKVRPAGKLAEAQAKAAQEEEEDFQSIPF